jgi:hypothetical protein
MLHRLKISSCLEECVSLDVRSLIYACLISTLIICMFVVPTFFNACGASGSDHTAAPGFGIAVRVRESSRIFPFGPNLIKSDQLIIYNVDGHLCVCSPVVSPGLIHVSSTRTFWFSNSSL